jgi:hypothetical protein
MSKPTTILDLRTLPSSEQVQKTLIIIDSIKSDTTLFTDQELLLKLIPMKIASKNIKCKMQTITGSPFTKITTDDYWKITLSMKNRRNNVKK